MIIQSLEVKDFRNYENLSVSFDPGRNILYGNNAQGKTNILEAMYLSATTKSHRGSKDKEMIRFGQPESHIRTVVSRKDKKIVIEVHLHSGKAKGIALNRVPIHKAADLFGLLTIVFFSPEDLHIIQNGPGARRQFLNMELSQLDAIYLSHLNQYHRALLQRNVLLKELKTRPDLEDTLTFWDEPLIAYGREIIKRRRKFTDELNGLIGEIHTAVTGGKEKLILRYLPDTAEDELKEALLSAKDRDRKYAETTVGPHRDDVGFFVNGMDVRRYGSQGQQKTCALSLKLAEIHLAKQLIGDQPVLFLDDVLSELDKNRQNDLLNSITGMQTFLTCTGLDEFVRSRFPVDSVWEVKEGRAVKKKGLEVSA